MHRKRKYAIVLLVLCALGAIGFIPIGGVDAVLELNTPFKVNAMNLSEFSSARPAKSLNLLFIHHSCGGQLFADLGPDVHRSCIYKTSTNGGGLRERLRQEGYIVHEASYDSEVGAKTDIFDWQPKFQQQMDKVLVCDQQNSYFKDATKNNIIVFKSCFPNNEFSGEGQVPGNPRGKELTTANAKAAYAALLPEFAKHAEVLFIAMTAPPLVGSQNPEPFWKSLARIVLTKPRSSPSRAGNLARAFNNWLVADDGWLADYSPKNVVVFDYFDILTDHGKSNYAEFPSGSNGDDSHPNAKGNTRAAQTFIPFINQAVRRAGLSGPESYDDILKAKGFAREIR
jgi:hypothetical protein